MRGLMMDRPLLISQQIRHADLIHGDVAVHSRESDGSTTRTTWRGVHRGAARLATALEDLGVGTGERVGTLAWNDRRHLELYFGVPAMGAVCHTINPRLHPAELAYVIDHAEDRWLFVDPAFLPLIEAVWPRLGTVEGVVVMTDRSHMPASGLPRVLCFDELVSGRSDRYDWPELDERTAASLCYTSGTTGHPKGVLYSHRSTVLHALGVSLPDVLGLGEGAVFLPVVPMFHACAWGAPYACAATGAGLVLPGAGLDGRSLTALMNEAGVTVTAGVPTIWMGLLKHWAATGEGVPSLRVVSIGGAAAPASMIRAFEEDWGIEVRHGWGMTEMSPVGTINALRREQRTLPVDERVDLQSSQGRPLFGVEMRVVGEDGTELPWDGESVGELHVRGPWVCSGYYRLDDSPSHLDDGWFATGDVVTLDARGYVRITDRRKDLIKSGGEWISSIDLENAAMGHPDVAHAAAVGVPDDKWGERPVLFVVPAAGRSPSEEDVVGFLAGRVAKWWLPDAVVFRDELPVSGTGKVQKARLREAWAATAPPSSPA